MGWFSFIRGTQRRTSSGEFEAVVNQGGNMSGVFKYPSTLKPDAYERLKRDLITQSVGLNKAHLPLLLEGGMQYERISIPPEDAQFINLKK